MNKLTNTSVSPAYKLQLCWLAVCLSFCFRRTQCSIRNCNLNLANAEDELDMYQEGDFIIGAVLTVHAGTLNTRDSDSSANLYCMEYDLRTHINVLVFRFAVHNINQNPEILPNITLGFHVTDSCLHVSLALRNVLHILSGPQNLVPNYSCSGGAQLAGFIGDHYSVTTIPMAQLLGIYGYTQISYGATDYALTNRYLYPHVFRTVQNDHVHYSTIIKMLKHFGWTWVGIFASNDDAGERETEILAKYMSSNGICLAFRTSIEVDIYGINGKHIMNVIESTKRSIAKVIVVCGSYFNVHLLAIIQSHFVFDKTFIFPPLWATSTSLNGQIIILNGSLTLELHPLPLPGTEHFFDGTNKMKSTDNSTFFQQFLTIAKSLSENRGDMTTSWTDNAKGGTFQDKYPNLHRLVHQGVAPRIYYAVEALAKALHNINLLIIGKPDHQKLNFYKYKVEKNIRERMM